MNTYYVLRTKGNVIVSIMYNRHNQKYHFVNLTHPHICSCAFDSVADALTDMDKKVYNGEILGYYKLYEPSEADGIVGRLTCKGENGYLLNIPENKSDEENECEWIPVSSGILPEHGVDVLLQENADENLLYVGHYNEYTKKFIWVDWEIDVIAWRPLPKKYKG